MKLGKLALVGALALGSLTVVSTLDTKSAAAATNVQKAVTAEDWGFKTIYGVEVGAKMIPDMYTDYMLSSYKTGGRPILITVPWDTDTFTSQDQIKVFKILPGGNLARYKTMNWKQERDYGSMQNVAKFEAQFTDAYDAGNYIAIGYVKGEFVKTDFVTINK
ncbi:TPA: DUF5065 family protein [Bacillus toyonensis]|uniref:DUF5065 family protein n=1 Tax=Bacillus TaxID=1386 RepID=UPI00103B680F|nr:MULTISPECIES: DUF5065 family protein [Bacillus]MBJ8067779.1 DUF5065 family protein [Bacillus cereus group sp. N15]MCS3599210.1 hypothetical protein [Bacillus sp. JUb91]TBX46456.1 DUF5065 family protein [Bacillus toyonensis]HDR7449323.1 DUF5065 family protein [Bacillus toyonensis]